MFGDFLRSIFAAPSLHAQALGDFLWIYAAGDILAALASLSLAVVFAIYARRRQDPVARRLVYGIVWFLCAAAGARLAAVWNLWHDAYLPEVALKGAAAVLAVLTAVWAAQYIPHGAKLPTPQELDRINESLRCEVEARTAAEEKTRRLLESERLASGARLRAFFEAAPQALLAAGPGGEILLVNRRTEQLFGYGRDELLGLELAALLPERYRDALTRYRTEYFHDPQRRGRTGFELHARRKDGTEFPVEVGVNFVETDEGVFGLALVNDVTARQAAQAELSRANADLRRSNAELEQFTYVASHDLQEPLRMVTSYLQLLERRAGAKLDEEESDFLQFAVEGAARMKTLIQDLLRLSRAGTQKLDLRVVAMGSLVETAERSLQAAIAESGAEISVGPLPAVEADGGLLTQVLQNLIANAVKFRAPSTAPRIYISARRKGGEWVFAVRDNGIGIDPRHSGRIFQMFERLHASEEYAGSGVGLAIAQRIVERHGGKIWVESQSGAGSTFYFSLPATAEAPMAASG